MKTIIQKKHKVKEEWIRRELRCVLGSLKQKTVRGEKPFLTAWEKAVEQGNIKLLSSSSLPEEQRFLSVTVQIQKF